MKNSLFVLLFSAPMLSIAQLKTVERSNQQWLHHYVSFIASEKLTLQVDAGFRTRNWFQEPALYLVRWGAAYRFHENWKVGAGFAHSGAFRNNELNRLEFRPHQELIAEHKVGITKLEQRFRVEERIFKVLNSTANSPVVVRFRYRFQLTVPLATLSKVHSERKLDLIMADEFFINAGKGISHNIFDHNRMIFGPSFQIKEGLNIALLYNYQFGTTTSPTTLRQDHVLWLTIRHVFDFRKKEEKPE